MAAILALREKSTGKLFTGAGLVEVDAALARAMGAEPDPVEWHANWVNWIGFLVAYNSDASLTSALAPSMANARAGEAQIMQWFIDNYDNASFVGR